jgi:hypothetical protein
VENSLRAYNHYVTRKGLSMPYVEEVLLVKGVRPEDDGASDGVLDTAHLGFGTFIYCSEGFGQE